MTTSWRFELTCCQCGGGLEVRAVGRSDGREVRAVADCPACLLEHVVAVGVHPTTRRPHKERRSKSWALS